MSPQAEPQMVFIVGAGRSGTTWLGDILSTNVNATYKYEPFSPATPGPYRDWVLQMHEADPSEQRQRFLDLAAGGRVGVDRPPYRSGLLKKSPATALQLHRLARRFGPAHHLFSRGVSFDLHRESAAILVKDVWLTGGDLPRCAEVLEPAIVTIVRHPHAAIASALRGVEMGVFQTDIDVARERIRVLVERNRNVLGDFADPDGLITKVDQLDRTTLEALRWRLEAEPVAAHVLESPRGHLVIYEDLVREPDAVLEPLYRFLGWDFDEPTRQHVAASQRSETRGDSARYYSTQRSPTQALEGWRASISEDQLSSIAEVVAPSPLLPLWDQTGEGGSDSRSGHGPQ